MPALGTRARLRRLVVLPALAAALLAGLLSAPGPAAASTWMPVEPYAPYEGQSVCSPWARPGTVTLANTLVRVYGGSRGAITRACSVGGASEHKEGRALDWTMNAYDRAQRAQVERFIKESLATSGGQHAARARRMGIMYIIWNDRIYTSWEQFKPRLYLHASCSSRAACSDTLRHRDHVHVSLSWAGARGQTSWYLMR